MANGVSARVLGLSVFVLLLVVHLASSIGFGTPLAFWRPADDAFYYYDTVRSVATGLGVSTDGLHPTSGFHPLWFVVLLPLGALFHEQMNALLIAAQVLGMALLSVAVGFTFHAARRLGSGVVAAAIGGASLLFAPWRGVASAGVEGALALALLTSFIVATTRVLEHPDDRRLLIAGTVAGLCVLARLDTVILLGFVISVTLGSLAKRGKDGRVTAAALRLVVTPSALVLTYLAVNLVRTGEWMPITASLKSTFPKADLELSFITGNIEYTLAIIVTWLGFGLATNEHARTILLGLSLGSTAFMLYLATFGQGVFWWHFVSLLPGGALGVAVTTDAVVRLAERRQLGRLTKRMLTAAAALVLIVPIGTSLAERSPDGALLAASGWRVEAERAGRWAADNLPSNALLAMKDSGAFGFYTSQPTMNLDGVISDRRFNEALCSGTAATEMARAGVSYVAHHRVPGDYERFEIRLPCWSEGTAPTLLEFSTADEVYRGPAYHAGDPDRHFVIWAWEPSNA